MGTAVLLSPYDCLVSHLNRDNQPLVHMFYPSPGTPRSKQTRQQQGSSSSSSSSSQAVMSSTISECVRHSSGSDVPFLSDQAATGILLYPESHTSSVTSVSGQTHFHPCIINNRCTSTSVLSPFTNSSFTQIVTSRSPSVDPISSISHRDNGHPATVERMYTSVGRRPFRPVQGNAVTSRFISGINFDAASLQEKAKLLKFSDGEVITAHSGHDLYVSKQGTSGLFNGADIVGDIRKRTQGDFLPRKGSPQGGSLRQTKRDSDVRKGGARRLANEITMQLNGDEGKAVRGSFPVVTILRTPETEEASGKVVANFDRESEGLSVGNSQVQKEVMSPSCKRTEILARSFSDIPVLDSSRTASASLIVKKNFHTCNNGVADHRRSQAFPGGFSQVERIAANSLASVVELPKGGKDLFSTSPPTAEERWAGPAYSISPPPSSLPLPKFSLRQQRSRSLELHIPNEHCTDSIRELDQRRTASAPSSPPGLSTHSLPDFPAHKSEVDIAFATKDLRRILNLDSC